MCHLNQLSQGGPDVLENVVMLCRFHHGVLDNRVQNGRREAVRVLLEAFVRRNQW
jgi:predicted restriction endonuclease